MTRVLRHIPVFFSVTIFSLILSATAVHAQSTKVKGRVVDAATGEGIPFAGIYFKNSTVGVTADLDGYFALETRIDTLTRLSASILGYEEQVKTISPRSFNDVRFRLTQSVNELNASVVKPDDRYVRSILRKVNDAKEKNDPERRPQYDCDIYSKNELDLVNPDNTIVKGLLPDDFMFVYDYIDTSIISGQPYLPVMIAEATSRFYHSGNPSRKKEVIKASRISGIDEQRTMAQFTGSMYIKPNFYSNFINIFEVEIPSPLSSSGNTYYNYYLVDSLDIAGRKTYKIRFHPSKWVSSPTFDGEMSIDATDFALKDIHARLKKGGNVNWVKDLAIDVVNQHIPDEGWFYGQEKICIDFSVVLRDSTRMISFLASRQIDYSDPSFKVNDLVDLLDGKAPVLMKRDVLNNDEAYWKEVRPYPLTEKEQGIYNMVDSIKQVPLYKSVEKLANMLATGFYEFKYLGIGPYSSIYSFNALEDQRVQFGLKTTKEFSRTFRVMGYMAYGFGDRRLKGGGVFEFMFNNQPTRKVSISYKHDVVRLGAGSFGFGNGDLMSSVLAMKDGQKLSMINDYSISYDHEWTQDVNMTFAIESRRIFSNEYVPMIRTDGSWYNSVGYNQAHFKIRLSKDQIVTRGVFEKQYFYTAYPVVVFDVAASMKGIGKNEYTFFRPKVSIDFTWLVPPFGASEINLRAGTIVGTVPYPMLEIHEGNGTYALHTQRFACMNYYEFASDSWATLFWEHNFKGFFLGKIPLVRNMNLREIAVLRAAYGTVRKENNGNPGDPDFGSGMLFPAGMKTLETPYVEMGFGISNIFRMVRVDFIWRLTHRNDVMYGLPVPHDNRFVVNIGFDLKL